MSEINNGGLDQYGAKPFEQQQFGTAGVEGVNMSFSIPFNRQYLSSDDCLEDNREDYHNCFTVVCRLTSAILKGELGLSD